MTIKDFLNTTNGARYAAALAGCSGTWAVEYWGSMDEYKTCFKTNKNDSDFVIVIN